MFGAGFSGISNTWKEISGERIVFSCLRNILALNIIKVFSYKSVNSNFSQMTIDIFDLNFLLFATFYL